MMKPGALVCATAIFAVLCARPGLAATIQIDPQKTYYVYGIWSETIQHCKVLLPFGGRMAAAEVPGWTGTCTRNAASGQGVLDAKMEFGSLHYEGPLLDGRPEGVGDLRRPDGVRYQGGFYAGAFQGHGVVTFPDGYRIEADFSNQGNDMVGFMGMQGEKQNWIPEGARFEGIGSHSLSIATGVLRYGNGDRYEGEFVQMKPGGAGTMRFASGAHYSGHWQDGRPDGAGVFTDIAGDRFEGDWHKGCLATVMQTIAVLALPNSCS